MSNDSTINAIDKGLSYLAAASTALEHTAKPDLKDVENAKEYAKKAHKILDAAYTLLQEKIYTVADVPAENGERLFDKDGQPGPKASVEDDVLTPDAKICTHPRCDGCPTEHTCERSTAKPLDTLGYTEPAETIEEAEIVPNKDVFLALLDELRVHGIDEKKPAKHWPKFRRAWEAAFEANPAETFAELQKRLKANEIDWSAPVFEPEEELVGAEA